MKKIFILLLTILTVVLSVPVTAAERSFEDILHDEIIQLIDIKQYGADENDEGIYLISVMESGYTEKGFSDQTALYVYLYNPSMKKITSSDLNAISMATEYDKDGKPVNFKKYRLQVEGSADGELYIRAKVAASAKTLACVRDGARWYSVTELELLDSKSYDVEAYSGGVVYKFSGYGSELKCECESFLTLELDVGHTSYLTGNSSMGVGYSNQISSVYFSIPNEIEQEYGKLYSIDYEYYKYRTAPILLHKNEDIEEAMKSPKLWESSTCLQKKTFFSFIDGSSYWDWVNVSQAPNIGFKINEYIVGKELVSSEKLQGAFIDYASAMNSSSSDLLFGKYHKACFDATLYTENNHKVVEHKTRDDMFSMDSYGETHGFLDKLFNFGILFGKYDLDETVKDAKFIQPVSSASFLSSDFSSEYLVAEKDKSALITYVVDAESRKENVYLLRFAYADNYFVRDGEDSGYRLFNASTGTVYDNIWLVEQDVYLKFDVLKLEFSDDGKEVTTFGVVSAPIDIFPSLGGIATGGGNDVDPDLSWLHKLAAVLLIGALGFSVIWVIGLFGQLGEASTNRQILRELKRRKRK